MSWLIVRRSKRASATAGVLWIIVSLGSAVPVTPAYAVSFHETHALTPQGPTGPRSWSDFNGDGFEDLAIGVPHESVGNQTAAGRVHVLYGTANGLSAANSQVWDADSAHPFPGAHANDHFGWVVATGNFDGDSYGDLAIGAPHQDDNQYDDGGGFFVLFGGPSGLSAADAIYESAFHRFGGAPAGYAGNELGFSLVASDLYDTAASTFDRDGRTELIVGSPGIGGNKGSITMYVLHATIRYFSNIQGFALSGVEAGDRCATSLASGNFDDIDGMDIAVGCPTRDYVQGGSGCVGFFHNDMTNLTYICQEAATVDTPEADDHFGTALAVGDFDVDGFDDLAVGVPDEDIGSVANAGMVHIFPGEANGGILIDPSTLTQESTGVPGSSAANDKFGAALAVGDFDGSDVRQFNDSLAIGVPGDDVGDIDHAGAVVVLYWHGGVMDMSSNQRWTQNSSKVLEKAAANDRFGASLTTGRFSSANVSDLVIGVPFENLTGPISDAGAVQVLYGTLDKLKAAGNQLWHQNSAGIADAAEPNDRFGTSIAAGPLP